MREGGGGGDRGELGCARGADPAPAAVPIAPFDRFPVICVHSDRLGGTSVGPFRSLNLGLSTADDPERVRENRRRWFAACGFSPARVVSPLQVHGSEVIRAGAADAGRGALDRASAPRADGLWTDEPGIALVAVSADCPLLALYDPERRAAAIVHAGWRGAAAGIAARAVAALLEAGSRPERIWAGIGPSIGPCCYPVGRDVAGALLGRLPEGRWIWPDGDRYRVDLAGFVAEDLIAAGVRPERIERSLRCTSCDAERLYSHRRARAECGRFGLLLALRP